VTTVDPKAAVVMVLIPDGLQSHVDSVLDALTREGRSLSGKLPAGRMDPEGAVKGRWKIPVTMSPQ